MRIVDGVALPSRPPERPFVRVGLRDEEGRVGIGEASPLPPCPPDTAEALASLLAAAQKHLPPIDDDLPPRTAVAAALASVEGWLDCQPAARFALETALFDLVGQRRDLSLAACLGGPSLFPRIGTNGLLFASAEDLVDRARALARRGIATFKVKLRARDASGFARELDALRALRCAFPPPFELRLDPNGAWTIPEAHEKLGRLVELAPRYVEQPVPAELLPDLGRAAVPWAADESLLLPGMAERLATMEGCAAFILKPAALGGLDRALAIAGLGAAGGRELVVTHYADGPIGLTAAAELARALVKMPLSCGLDRHSGLEAYPALSIPALRGAFVEAAPRPGLGFSEEDRRRWFATD